MTELYIEPKGENKSQRIQPEYMWQAYMIRKCKDEGSFALSLFECKR
jgi:hypothetical protein